MCIHVYIHIYIYIYICVIVYYVLRAFQFQWSLQRPFAVPMNVTS